jgi:S1-C subfamily serine protease
MPERQKIQRRNLLAMLGALPAAACAQLPATQALGTPAAGVARESTVSLLAHGSTVGAAVAVPGADGPLLLTNAHVLHRAGRTLTARRTDGGAEAPVQVLALSDRLDLAVLRVPEGMARPVHLHGAMPERGASVWAVGPEGLGRGIAQGQVLRPRVIMVDRGPGFTARLGALMGFSGGPVLDAEGRLLGLTTALPDAGAAPLLAGLTGLDVTGLAAGDQREVFALSIAHAMAEVRRLAT